MASNPDEYDDPELDSMIAALAGGQGKPTALEIALGINVNGEGTGGGGGGGAVSSRHEEMALQSSTSEEDGDNSELVSTITMDFSVSSKPSVCAGIIGKKGRYFCTAPRLEGLDRCSVASHSKKHGVTPDTSYICALARTGRQAAYCMPILDITGLPEEVVHNVKTHKCTVDVWRLCFEVLADVRKEAQVEDLSDDRYKEVAKILGPMEFQPDDVVPETVPEDDESGAENFQGSGSQASIGDKYGDNDVVKAGKETTVLGRLKQLEEDWLELHSSINVLFQKSNTALGGTKALVGVIGDKTLSVDTSHCASVWDGLATMAQKNRDEVAYCLAKIEKVSKSKIESQAKGWSDVEKQQLDAVEAKSHQYRKVAIQEYEW